MESLQEYDPDMSVEEAQRAKNSKDPTDVKFWGDFQYMCSVKNGEQIPQRLNPKSNVNTSSCYTVQIYRKIGLIADSDLVKLTGATAKVLGLKAVDFRLDGPCGPKTSLYPISLSGLPASVADGMLKMKVVFSSGVEHAEFTLCYPDQILQEQGASMFNNTVRRWNESSRPVKISSDAIKTLEDLVLLSKSKEVPEEPEAEEEEESEEVEAPSGPVRRGVQKFTIGSSEATKVKAKAKPKAKLGAAAGASKASVAAAARDKSPSASGTGSKKTKLSKNEKLVQEAEEELADDAEMLRVALKSLTTDKGSGIKCLTSLKVKAILQTGSRPNNALTGVGVHKMVDVFFIYFQVLSLNFEDKHH